jgi:hypothetical protein
MKDAGKGNPTVDAGKFMHLKQSYPETWKKLVQAQKSEDDAWGMNATKVAPPVVEPAPKLSFEEAAMKEEQKKVENKLNQLMHKGVNTKRTPCGSFFST